MAVKVVACAIKLFCIYISLFHSQWQYIYLQMISSTVDSSHIHKQDYVKDKMEPFKDHAAWADKVSNCLSQTKRRGNLLKQKHNRVLYQRILEYIVCF